MRAQVRIVSQPGIINKDHGNMRAYQVQGLNWLANLYQNGISGILADEMGLGKTLQTIAVIAHLKFGLKQPGASLVVCPLSVLSTWCAELKRWCPSLRTIKLHSSDVAERERLKTQIGETIGEYDVVVTTYEMVSPPPPSPPPPSLPPPSPPPSPPASPSQPRSVTTLSRSRRPRCARRSCRRCDAPSSGRCLVAGSMTSPPPFA